MKKSVLSLLTGAALLGTVGVASAAEPMVLTNAAMDGITAGDINTIQAASAEIKQHGLVNIATIVQVQVVAVRAGVDIDVLNN